MTGSFVPVVARICTCPVWLMSLVSACLAGPSMAGPLDRGAIIDKLERAYQTRVWGNSNAKRPAIKRESVRFKVRGDELHIVRTGQEHSLRKVSDDIEYWQTKIVRSYVVKIADLFPTVETGNMTRSLFHSFRYGKGVGAIHIRCWRGACIRHEEEIRERCVDNCSPFGRAYSATQDPRSKGIAAALHLPARNAVEAKRVAWLINHLIGPHRTLPKNHLPAGSTRPASVRPAVADHPHRHDRRSTGRRNIG